MNMEKKVFKIESKNIKIEIRALNFCENSEKDFYFKVMEKVKEIEELFLTHGK